MTRAAVNFAGRTGWRALGELSIASLLMAGTCIAGIVGIWVTWQQQDDERIALERQAARLETRLREKQTVRPTAPASPALSDAAAHAVNGAVARLNLPWSSLFDGIEAATPPAIALLSLEPNARKGVLKGTAEAENTDDMFAYISALKARAEFSAVLLARHEINEQDVNKPVRFQFEAVWREKLP